jgi:WD40 repeat protein/transcriptional regulator with XRE-family HTH domain
MGLSTADFLPFGNIGHGDMPMTIADGWRHGEGLSVSSTEGILGYGQWPGSCMGEKSRFAAELRRRRQDRGLSLAALSGLTHYSKGYLSNVENGRKPPTADLARRLDAVLGADGALIVLVTAAQESPCPYRGLAVFGPQDARWFFGRDRLTAELVSRLAECLSGGTPLVVFGASGSGKSSVLRAGLLPAVARGALPAAGSAAWPVLLITPTAQPVTAVARGVADLFGTSESDVRGAVAAGAFPTVLRSVLGADDARLVLVVDQFEEIFTLCESETERSAVVQALCAAAAPGPAAPPALVVLGIRADFYPRCLAYPDLLPAVTDHQVAVGAMSRDELVEAIAGPADAAALTVEPGLVELLVRDLGVDERRDSYEPGSLPLLSHALLMTWQQRTDDRLTVAGYQVTGGVHGAVAATAERVYTQLDDAAQHAARRLLLRLVRVGEEGGDTRRRVHRDLLADHGPTLAAMEALAAARLLVLDRDTVEITHEALLWAWPRLRAWIDSDRAGLRVRQRLTEAADVWQQHGRAASMVYRGGPLAGAQQWADAHDEELTALERDFLKASVHVERRGIRVLRRLVVALVVFVILTTIAGGVAVVEREQAFAERDAATSRQAGERAVELLASDPSLAAQIGLAAHHIADTAASRSAVLSTFASPYPTRLHGGGDQIDVIALREDGNLLATGGIDGLLQLWDAADGRRAEPVATLPNTGRVTGLAFGQQGRLLAASSDGGVRLWDVSRADHANALATVGPTAPTNRIGLSADGTLLATAESGGKPTRLWDIRDPRHPIERAVLPGHTGEINGIAFSPAEPVLVTTGKDGRVLLWDVRDPTKVVGPHLVTEAKGLISGVAFSPDGRTLALADDTHTIVLCTVNGLRAGAPSAFPGPDTLVRGLAFSPDGARLALGGNDGYIRIMDVAARQEIARLTHPNRVRAVAFDRSGTKLASSSSAGRAYLWHLPLPNSTGHRGDTQFIFVDPRTGIIATTGNLDQRVRLWRTTDWQTLRPLATLTGHTDTVLTAAFNQARPLLATAGQDHTVRLWDITRPDRPAVLAVLAGYRQTVSIVAWSADGRTVATGDDAGELVLWDVTEPRSATKLATLTDGFRNVNAVDFSPDGRYLASGNTDRTIRLWDLNDRTRPRQIAKLDAFREAVTNVRFSPDSRRLAAGSLDQTARLWDITDASQPSELATISGYTGAVWTTRFSPDNRTLITANGDHSTRIWNLDNPQHPTLVATLRSPGMEVTNVVFTPAGKRIAVASNEHIIRFWDTDIDTAARQICALAGTPITPEEWTNQFGNYPYKPPCPAK